MRSWFAATALLTSLVVFSAGAAPWVAAIGGAFSPPDFAQDVAAARSFAQRADPYVADFAAQHARVLGVRARDGYPYLPHPPFAIALTWPFAQVSFGTAARWWFALSLALCFVLAIVLTGLAMSPADGRRPAPREALLGFAALLLWPPVLYNLEKGQFSILLATLIAVAWVSLARRDSAVAGLWIGIAAAVKLFPVLIGVYLVCRRRRAAISCAIAGVVLTALPFFWIGWHVLPEFLSQSAGNLSYWQTWPAVTYSVHGLSARMFIGGHWSLALTQAPNVARLIVGLASAVLVALAFRTTLQHETDDSDGLLFAIWSVLLVPLNPLAMGHNGVLLALPIVLIGRALASDRRVWPKIMWSAGCVLVSIPRQTIFEAAPIPVTPWRSLAIVALPLWGSLLLFGAGIAVARRTTAPRCATHPQEAPQLAVLRA